MRKIKEENKLFYLFLFIHFLVWTLIGMIRTVLPTDALEGIYWGSLHDFGTPKHPPLAGWLTYLAFLPFKKDICIYFMSQAFIIGGFIYIYKLAKYFLTKNQAILSVMILEGCWVYSYITGYYGFNPDVILLLILPMISYYFYNCMHDNKLSNWIKLGVIVGIAFLNKYQTGMIIFMIATWAFMFKKETFKNKYFYLSIIIAFFIFLPHLLWLIKYDFFPLLYFEHELSDNSWWHHLTAPLIFLIVQISVIIGSVVIFSALKLKNKSKFSLSKNLNPQDMWFILLLGLGPFVLHMLMGLYAGGTMRPRWGFEFWYMTGIMLFYFFPINVELKDIKYTFKASLIVMFIIFLSLGTLLTVEKNYRSRYPVAHIMNDLNNAWNKTYPNELKYIGGYIEWTLPLTIYGNTHPKCILDLFGYPDPWIKEQELKKHGVLIIDRTIKKVKYYTLKSCPYLPKDYEINPIEYRFLVHNALGQPREYKVYYFIVPPQNN